MKLELPVCKFRGEEISPDRFPCSSPFIMAPAAGVCSATCLSCRYANKDQEAKAKAKAKPKPPPTRQQQEYRQALQRNKKPCCGKSAKV